MSRERRERCAGFVLAGGLSSRMGRDKALLDFGGVTLLERISDCVRQAAGNVTVIAPPARYRGLGLAIEPDCAEGCGPLGGVWTALKTTRADWNLIVACDMPGLTTSLLGELLDAAERSQADCVVAQSERGIEPLCAVYHRRCEALAGAAIRSKSFKMHDFLSTLQTIFLPVADPAAVRNINFPQDREGA